MEPVLIAVAVMVLCSLSVHLGLSHAVGEVLDKITGCHKCLTFWICLAVLMLSGYGIIISATVSILASYLSNFFMLLLMLLRQKYDRLWKRIRKTRK